MEADLNLLETARRCELYGVKMHNVKVRVPRSGLCHILIFSGPRRSVPWLSSGPPWCPRVSVRHQDQLLLLGQGPEAQLQAEEIPH